MELDGAWHYHFDRQNKDFERTLKLETLGFKVVRFENKVVFENLESLLNEIKANFKGRI